MADKSYRFFVHFNRINMQRGNPRVWTIHFRGVCYQVVDYICHVPHVSRYVFRGRQPRATIRGLAKTVVVHRSGIGEIA